ncbi:MAG: DUF3256 family protein [Prevotella sp.]|nr:DUF3256 family protein [Prevotella sp.]
MKKQLLTLFWLLLAVLPASAQTLREAWVAMPDSLLPYLDKGKRAQLLELNDARMPAEVDNKLQGKSRLDTLLQNFLQVSASESMVLQMKLLPSQPAEGQGADSVLCVVQTVKGPCPESRVRLFSRSWELLSDTCYRDKKLLMRPDTISAERFAELLESIPLVMWKSDLLPDADELVLTPSLPMLFVEEKEKKQPLLLQINLKWNGKTFK